MAEAVLLLLVITAATTTLALALALHDVTNHPYSQTRAETAGPDLVANAPETGATPPVSLSSLANAPGVVRHSGPYPLAWPTLRSGNHVVDARAEGRSTRAAQLDQPKVTAGTWLRSGSAVIERSFADALGVHVGDTIRLDGRPFTVVGLAVTAASAQYPTESPGLVWVTTPAATSLAAKPTANAGSPLSTLERPAWTLNLTLKNSAEAPGFAAAHSSVFSGLFVTSWRSIANQDASLVQNAQQDLEIGSVLLGLLAVASVVVLVGGRMAEQTRRVGLLKAVGATPAVVAQVLLAENVCLGVVAAAIGLICGWQLAPLLSGPGAGVVGAPAAPAMTSLTVLIVVAAALFVAGLATFVPAVRAARTTTVGALNDAARPPNRSSRLIAVSAALPVPFLLGVRLAARRPRRALLSAASIALTVATLVAVLIYHEYAHANQQAIGLAGLTNPVTDRNNRVIAIIAVVLALMAAINIVFVAWATVHDARRPSALARSLGATPQQVSSALVAAQLVPSMPAAISGVPSGIAVAAAAGAGSALTLPPAGWLALLVVGTVVMVAVLTAIPAGIGARRPVVPILQADSA